MGMTGPAQNASVVQASMPTTVSVVALSTEFGTDAQEVGGVVFLSTLASALSLTGLLVLLGQAEAAHGIRLAEGAWPCTMQPRRRGLPLGARVGHAWPMRRRQPCNR